MSNQTYITFYENEVRAVEISVRDQDDAVWTPSSAYISVIDEAETIIVAETPAMVTSNTILGLIDATVTVTPGKYYIIWRILKTSGESTYTFYHKTTLVVEEL